MMVPCNGSLPTSASHSLDAWEISGNDHPGPAAQDCGSNDAVMHTTIAIPLPYLPSFTG